MDEYVAHAQVHLEQDICRVSGVLSHENVMAIHETCLPWFAYLPVLKFDFKEVVASDSAGLALMVEWLQYAKQHDKPIYFRHLPAALLSLAKTAGLAELLIQPEPA